MRRAGERLTVQPQTPPRRQGGPSQPHQQPGCGFRHGPAGSYGPRRRDVLLPHQEVGAIDDAVSTVDDLEDFRGRAATVLALADLGAGRVGHYGLGPGADRLVPADG